MTIGQVVRQSGIPASTLRYYERIGLLPAPRRVSGQRRYDPDALKCLAWIQLAQRAGFKITEIKKLLYGFQRSTSRSDRWRTMATRKLAAAEERTK